LTIILVFVKKFKKYKQNLNLLASRVCLNRPDGVNKRDNPPWTEKYWLGMQEGFLKLLDP
jgi:hypothetical protein